MGTLGQKGVKEDVGFYEFGSEAYYLLLESAFSKYYAAYSVNQYYIQNYKNTNLRKEGLGPYILNSKKKF